MSYESDKRYAELTNGIYDFEINTFTSAAPDFYFQLTAVFEWGKRIQRAVDTEGFTSENAVWAYLLDDESLDDRHELEGSAE